MILGGFSQIHFPLLLFLWYISWHRRWTFPGDGFIISVSVVENDFCSLYYLVMWRHGAVCRSKAEAHHLWQTDGGQLRGLISEGRGSESGQVAMKNLRARGALSLIETHCWFTDVSFHKPSLYSKHPPTTKRTRYRSVQGMLKWIIQRQRGENGPN